MGTAFLSAYEVALMTRHFAAPAGPSTLDHCPPTRKWKVANVPAPGESLFARLEPLLPSVQKPIQYVGGELNATLKDWGSDDGAGEPCVR